MVEIEKYQEKGNVMERKKGISAQISYFSAPILVIFHWKNFTCGHNLTLKQAVSLG